MSHPGQKNLMTDVAGLRVGNAHDETVLTGATVILCESPSVAGVAVAGGGPGTRETDLLGPDKLVDNVNAIVLSGGSAYGLAAADGVAAMLGARGVGYAMADVPGVPKTPIVPAAILYDLANRGDKDWQENPPYQALGRDAFEAAAEAFDLGRAGAGFGARAGKVRGGLGSASIVTEDGMSVGALAAINSFGSVYMPGTDAFWAWPFELNGEFGGVRPPADYAADAEDWGAAKQNPQLGQNTTIACVATDVALTPGQAHRVAQMALSGFSRAIRPVFAPFDGDVVFVVSTAQQPLPEPSPLALARLGELAASTLARAIARGVYEAQ
ncbi:MAG: P1 family peptidase [Henriciella sp.]|nr:P1 family peptidase [Henriciella sp.]